MNCLGSRILIPFSKNVAMSKIMCLLFNTPFASCYSIYITLRYAFSIVCTYVVCCTFNCTSMDSYSSFTTTFSSFAFFCIIKWCFSTSFSSNFSMHTGSTDVAHSLVYFHTHQCCLLLHKNSTANVLVVSMSWIIICVNYIFSLYAFPSTHSEDDDECGGDLTTNSWIFNTLLLAFLNSSSTYVLFNKSTSSSCLHLCSLFCASFSLAIHYSFSIALFAFCYELQNFENAHNFQQQM